MMISTQLQSLILEALEDDLDFFSFAGVASPRILSLMEGAVALN